MAPERAGIVIVGAGPAGLACAVTLACHGHGRDVEVVDPAGGWLAAWRHRFAAQDIPYLRSPAVHHPHPDPFALLRHADGDGLVPSGGTQLPTTDLFARYVDDLVDEFDLADAVTPTTVDTLHLDERGRPTLDLGDGSERRPERVVLATNARQPVVPAPFAPLLADGRARLAEHADVRDTPAGAHVVVVGGGLSAAHLAIGAARRGAQVTLLTRRRLTVRRFDTHPSWLGPKKRRPFEAEPDPHVRRRIIDTARGGGSVPHRFRRELERCADAGRLVLRERVEVVDASPVGDRVRLHLDAGSAVDADLVWLATGGRIDVTRDTVCRSLVDRLPTAVADGLPVLDDDLCWPGAPVHLVGFAAALTLGPTAGNLVGQRRGAMRVAAAVRGDDPVRADRIATGAGACPTVPPRRRVRAATGTGR